jgi:amino acid transporter
MSQVAPELPDDEAARLEALGYTSEFKREMSMWANFSLGFTYLSPVVATYTLFGIAVATGGPPMIWWLVIVGIGQFLVALVFGEVVSQYPVAGGVYPWARRLWGRRWAWMTGWVYLVALLTTIAGVVYGSGPYLAVLLGFEAGTGSTITCALIMLAIALALNMLGTRVLAMAAMIGFTAELVGALAVGGWLLLTERHQNLSVLFDTQGVAGEGSYLAAFFAAAIIGVYQYYGFEACGDVAEEVPDPTREIPKAMRMTIYIGGAASILVCLSLLLAVKDFGAIISGEDADPVMTILNDTFGTVGTKFVLVVVMVSFLSCTLSLMAAASRLMYSYARDDMIFGSHLLRHFDKVRHVPPYAMIVAATVPAVIVLGSVFSAKALTQIVSFAILGIYLGFQMVVLAALRARLKGWVPSGSFTLGRWGMPVTIAALTYGVLTMINVAWPRTPDVPWYDNWVVVLSAVVGIGVGAIYMVIAKPYTRSEAVSADAIPTAPASTTSNQVSEK